MKTPHKHAELIKAWADGAEIECRIDEHDSWVQFANPNWNNEFEYRIKPDKKPLLVLYACTFIYDLNKDPAISPLLHRGRTYQDTLKLTFNSETNKLIKAEVI